MFRILTIFALILLYPVLSYAQTNMDAGLYDPVPPEGSVFVRFIGAQSKEGSDPAKLNGKIIDYIDYKEISSYFVVPKGTVKAEVGQAQKEFEAKEGGFYTLALTKPGVLELYEDENNNNRAKAQIVFYNFSPSPLMLKTEDGKVEVVAVQEPGKSNSRQINPVKVTLAVFDGDKKVKSLEAISLERGRSYTITALPDDSTAWVRSSTNTTR